MSGEYVKRTGPILPQNGDGRDWRQDDDPLAELARLVGEPEPVRSPGRREGEFARRTTDIHAGYGGRQEPTFGEPVYDDAPDFEELDPPGGWDSSPADGGYEREPDLFSMLDTPENPEEYDYEETEPVYADDGHMPPHGEGVEDSRSGKRRGGLVTIVTIFMVALLGGGALAAYSYFFGDAGPGGPPPVIEADGRPVKENVEIESASKENYDRATQDANGQTRLMGPEEPVERPVGPARDVSRVITPGGGSQTVPVAIPDQAASAPGAAQAPVEGPRRVRTIMVGPDGRPIESAPAAAAAPDPIQLQAPQAATAAGTVPGGAPQSMNDLMSRAAGTEPSAAPSGATQPSQPQAALPPPVTVGGPIEIQGAPDSPAEGMSLQTGTEFGIMEEPVAPAAARVPMPVPRPAGLGTSAVAAPARQPVGQPTQLIAAAPPQAAAPAVTQSAPTGRGFVVQVSSQRSESEARGAFQGLQRRYPQILGSYQPLIQQANLGDRGTYYRVRVGPLATRDEANLLCNNLRNAGGECIVQPY